ncbi:MAG TPA: hypothetical protein VJK03_00495 [Candidatus Nanoarchaeia archaeon]|nr:hypothetical protein [Candidatus Nanoarchaeia archaeon]
MSEKNIVLVLKKLIELTKNSGIVWHLEGSANLLVQGISIKPRDIDITTKKEHLNHFMKVLEKFNPKEKYLAETKAHLVKCFIEGVEIEIASYEKPEFNRFDKIKTAKWKGLSVPIMPLPIALEFYRQIGRKDKVTLIEKYLSTSG